MSQTRNLNRTSTADSLEYQIAAFKRLEGREPTAIVIHPLTYTKMLDQLINSDPASASRFDVKFRKFMDIRVFRSTDVRDIKEIIIS